MTLPDSLSAKRQLVAIVDDEPSILRGLKRLLDARGFATAVFHSGEEFLQSDGAGRATCVVLDIHLDGISGIETRRALSASGSRIPVIFMTALDTATVRREAMATGCAAYLRKPFSGHELIDAIQNATTAI
jgi:FixJ family two-component response regulator